MREPKHPLKWIILTTLLFASTHTVGQQTTPILEVWEPCPYECPNETVSEGYSQPDPSQEQQPDTQCNDTQQLTYEGIIDQWEIYQSNQYP